MNKLKVGFARTDITPPLGIQVDGYAIVRIADGVLDPLEINAIAMGSGETTVLFESFDVSGIGMETVAVIKKEISKRTGLDPKAIIISATHTHTGPMLTTSAAELNDEDKVIIEKHLEFVISKAVSAAVMALDDMKDAKMGWRVGTAPNVAFVRRFRMKDGYVRTNPGVGNPDILEPIGKIDEKVSVIRFDREGAESIAFINFANHPDVIGGCKISADWPGLARRVVERSIPNVKCIFVNGAEGDINHVNVKAKDGDMNDLENDFDDVLRGYGHAQHIASVVAGAVMQVYSKVNYTDVNCIKYIEKTISVATNKPKPEELPLARKYMQLHTDGRDDEIPFKAMELTTVVAEARRMLRLENGPDSVDMTMTGVTIGDVAFITIPGEGFNYIGRELKKCEDWSLTVPCGLSNGYQGYFPTQEAYDEGGYETRSSDFKAGVAEKFVEEGLGILKELKNLK